MEPLVADIKRNALDDGPGIRTTVFLKGCPLACVWCHNPEMISPGPEVQRRAGACVGCGECGRACTSGAVSMRGGAWRRDAAACGACGACADRCPAAAIRVIGTGMKAGELVGRLAVDEPFWRNSGGGVTFSGGEPTLHMEFVAEAARALKARGTHLLLQTCGLYAADPFERDVLPLFDAVWFDVKLVDAAEHERRTGRDNGLILANLRRLAALVPDRLLPRVPLVPGVTDTGGNLRAAAALLRDLGIGRVALLPYNPLGVAKNREIGREPAYDREAFMPPAEVERCRGIVLDAGLALA